MSTSFYVHGDPPDAASVIDAIAAALGRDDLGCAEHGLDGLRGPWPEGVRHLYVDGRSTRGVEVVRVRARVQVRLLALSADADYELGLALIAAFAGERLVELDDGDLVTAVELRATHDASWRARDREVGVHGLQALLAHQPDGIAVEVPGAIRSFYVGPRVLAEVTRDGVVDGAALIEAMRRVQWPPIGYAAASLFEVARADGEPHRVAVIPPRAGRLVPPVSHLAFVVGDAVVHVPIAQVAEVLGDRARLVDEKQLLVDAVPEPDWPHVIARAAARGEAL